MNDLARRIVDAVAAELARAILLTEKDKERLAMVVRRVLKDNES